MAQPPYVVIPIEPTFRITDWNGRAIEAAQSRGNVVAVADFSDNLMRLESALWPTAAVLQKLCRNPRHEEAFDGQARQLLTERLGFYSDLQSLHSEDAITWSFFGTLSMASPVKRTAFCGSNYRRTKKIARLNSGAVYHTPTLKVWAVLRSTSSFKVTGRLLSVKRNGGQAKDRVRDCVATNHNCSFEENSATALLVTFLESSDS